MEGSSYVRLQGTGKVLVHQNNTINLNTEIIWILYDDVDL